MPEYNGHKNYNAWNISLWLHNDEGLYHTMCEYRKAYGVNEGAKMLYKDLIDYYDLPKTPDGVKWSITNIKLAMQEV